MSDWSKKLAFVLVVVICATVLTALGHLGADAWTSVMKWLGGIYVAAQAGVDAIERFTAKPTPSKE